MWIVCGANINTCQICYAFEICIMQCIFSDTKHLLKYVVLGCLTFFLKLYWNKQIDTAADATYTLIDNIEASCLSLCLDRENCRLFSYYTPDKTCRLYDSLTLATTNQSVLHDSIVIERVCHEIAGLCLLIIDNCVKYIFQAAMNTEILS